MSRGVATAGAPLPLPADLAVGLRRALWRRRATALLLTLPLFAFLLLTLLIPIGVLLTRAVENPEIAGALPGTVQALRHWDRVDTPPEAAFAALLGDLAAIRETADAGALARRLNTEISGARSLIMGTYRALPERVVTGAGTVSGARDWLVGVDPRWAEPAWWIAIAKNSARWTPDYLLGAVDLRRDARGTVIAVDDEHAAFRRIFGRTFRISAAVTAWCLVLGYPLAWWLSTLPARRANLLMIVVLVPFWTSILVRVAAWIVLLQSEGLVNQSLRGIGLIDEPLALLFNRTGVLIAMVHILLPYMILPLYSVMKAVPPTYLRAAVSLGSPPLAAFFRVVVQQTYPGIGAGALLVFILSIGYYVTPALLGGADDQMISYYIAQYTNVSVNWGVACGLGAVLLAATLLLYAVYRRVVRTELALG